MNSKIEDFISYGGDPIAGYSSENFQYRPIDTSRKDEESLQKIYDLFLDYFGQRAIGFKPSAFYGYDLKGIIGVWSYCYSINYLEKYDPAAAIAYHEANENFLWQPPASLHEKVSDYFFAPVLEGENPALWIYGQLKEQMRRHGEKPTDLADLPFDDLLLAADHIGGSRYWLQFGGNAESYMATTAGIIAYHTTVRALGIAGMVIGGADFFFGLIESAIDEEILRRIDTDANDELDEAYLRARTRELDLRYVTLEIGSR